MAKKQKETVAEEAIKDNVTKVKVIEQEKKEDDQKKEKVKWLSLRVSQLD